ncbi:unnamed protein product [Heterobilharzia americana]|nr:unnamed protein product [Heterobilharzia americana]
MWRKYYKSYGYQPQCNQRTTLYPGEFNSENLCYSNTPGSIVNNTPPPPSTPPATLHQYPPRNSQNNLDLATLNSYCTDQMRFCSQPHVYSRNSCSSTMNSGRPRSVETFSYGTSLRRDVSFDQRQYVHNSVRNNNNTTEVDNSSNSSNMILQRNSTTDRCNSNEIWFQSTNNNNNNYWSHPYFTEQSSLTMTNDNRDWLDKSSTKSLLKKPPSSTPSCVPSRFAGEINYYPEYTDCYPPTSNSFQISQPPSLSSTGMEVVASRSTTSSAKPQSLSSWTDDHPQYPHSHHFQNPYIQSTSMIHNTNNSIMNNNSVETNHSLQTNSQINSNINLNYYHTAFQHNIKEPESMNNHNAPY